MELFAGLLDIAALAGVVRMDYVLAGIVAGLLCLLLWLLIRMYDAN